jgi:hypothetical protein
LRSPTLLTLSFGCTTAGEIAPACTTIGCVANWRLTGLPGGNRTPDPQLRRLLLYPTELRADEWTKAPWDLLYLAGAIGFKPTTLLSQSCRTFGRKIKNLGSFLPTTNSDSASFFQGGAKPRHKPFEQPLTQLQMRFGPGTDPRQRHCRGANSANKSWRSRKTIGTYPNGKAGFSLDDFQRPFSRMASSRPSCQERRKGDVRPCNACSRWPMPPSISK